MLSTKYYQENYKKKPVTNIKRKKVNKNVWFSGFASSLWKYKKFILEFPFPKT